MQIVIDISEEEYSLIKKCLELGGNHAYRLIANGIVLPKGHEDLISREALKREFETTPYNDYDDLLRTERLIDEAPSVIEVDK